MDILRAEVSDGKVDLIMNPEVIPLAFDSPLRAESFAALINSYALLSPRHDRFFALCFKGAFRRAPCVGIGRSRMTDRILSLPPPHNRFCEPVCKRGEKNQKLFTRCTFVIRVARVFSVF